MREPAALQPIRREWVAALKRAKNAALMSYHYRLGSLRLPYPPLLVNLEPTNYCNLRCPMCPVAENHDNLAVARGIMDWGLFETLASGLAEFQPAIALNLGGESTLHPALHDMVAVLKRRGLFVFIDTNASILSIAKSQNLLDSQIDEIVVCLDGYDPESYEEIRARAKYEKTVHNIKNLLLLKAKSRANKTRIVVKNIRYLNAPGPDNTNQKLKDLFSDVPPDEYRFTWADYWPGRHRDTASALYKLEPIGNNYEKCINLWKMMAVSWDGMVHICCLDLNRTVPIGRVQDFGLLGIWNHEKFQALRLAHRQSEQSKLPLCGSCNQIRRVPPSHPFGLIRTRRTRFTRWDASSSPAP